MLAVTVMLGCAGSMRVPARSDDPGIAQLIALRLSSDQRLCPFDITVAVRDRIARLEGKVSSDAERRRAQQLARDAGALHVDDQLTIDPSAGDPSRC